MLFLRLDVLSKGASMAKKQAVFLVSRSFDEAANLMWNYYSANKLILQADIRESREHILKELMQGRSVEDVFAPYVLPADVIEAMFKQAQKLNKRRA
jgi:hypothetical protein